MNCKNVINFVIIVAGIYLIYQIQSIENENFTQKSEEKKQKIYYNIVELDELSREITEKAKKNSELKKMIDTKMVEVYQNIKTNSNLKNRLRFMNLINDENMPLFINEHKDNLLFNQVKILLFTNKIDKTIIT